MADKLGFGNEVRDLKLGQSFMNPKSSAFHAIRYDFKPASVGLNKVATVDVGNNNQVTVTVPHLDGAGVPQTVFKGSQRPVQKECVLIIDRVTGEIVLEKLSSHIQVKKTRSEAAPKPVLHSNDRSSDKSSGVPPSNATNSNSSSSGRPQTPPMVGQRSSSRTKVTSGARKAERHITHLVPKHSPLHASPNYNNSNMGSMNSRSPKRNSDFHPINNENHNQSVLASVPSLVDDFMEQPPQAPMSIQSRTMSNLQPSNQQTNNTSNIAFEKSPTFQMHDDNGVEEMSDSSSSYSSSDSESDVDRPSISKNPILQPTTQRNNTNGYSNTSSSHVFDDLQLSEDSD